MSKTVVITGASKGIGKEIAILFSSKNYNVAIISRNINLLKNTNNELKNINKNTDFFQCDIKNIDDIKKTINKIIERFSTIDILINSAGISYITPSDEDNSDKWIEQIEVNLIGTYFFTKECFLKMKEKNFGRIINISSIYGLIGGESYSAYCASKHGLNGLTKSLALEYAKYNITVNAICPSWVKTDMFDKDMEELSNYYKIEKNDLIESELISTPSGCFTTSNEIAELCLFLSQEYAKNITGQLINISGGLGI